MPKVTVYSTTTCPYCVTLTRWLNEQNIKYDEYKVDQNPIAAENMVRLSGQMGVPFTTIENDEGMTMVLGFDLPKLKQALGTF